MRPTDAPSKTGLPALKCYQISAEALPREHRITTAVGIGRHLTGNNMQKIHTNNPRAQDAQGLLLNDTECA